MPGFKRPPNAYTGTNLGGTAAAIHTALNIRGMKYTNNGFNMQRTHLNGKTVTLPYGNATLSYYNGSNDYLRSAIVGPDQDVRYLKRHRGIAGKDNYAHDFPAMENIDNMLIGNALGAAETHPLMYVDLTRVKSMNNVDLRNVWMNGATVTTLTVPSTNFGVTAVGTAITQGTGTSLISGTINTALPNGAVTSIVVRHPANVAFNVAGGDVSFTNDANAANTSTPSAAASVAQPDFGSCTHAEGLNLSQASIRTVTTTKTYKTGAIPVALESKGIKGDLLLKSGGDALPFDIYEKAYGVGQVGCMWGPVSDLNGCSFSGSDAAVRNVTKSLEDADLSGVEGTINNVNFNGQSLKNAKFNGRTFTKCSFGAANITGANFSSAIMNGTANTTGSRNDLSDCTTGTASNLPNFNAAELQYAAMFANATGAVASTTAYEQKIDMKGANLSNATWDQVNFQFVRLDNGTLTNGKFTAATGADLQDTILTGANLTNLKAEIADGTAKKIILTGVDMDGATITGANFSPALTDAEMSGLRAVNLIAASDSTEDSVQLQWPNSGGNGSKNHVIKDGAGKYHVLPNGATSEINLNDVTIKATGYASRASVALPAGHVFGKGNLSNLTLQFMTLDGFTISHTPAAGNAGYLKNFMIKNCEIQDGTYTVPDGTADDDARKLWGVYELGSDAATRNAHLPSGVASSTLNFWGNDNYATSNAKYDTDNLVNAQMVGGSPIDHSGLTFTGLDIGTAMIADAATLENADLSDVDFTGAKHLTDPGQDNFPGCKLPTASGRKAVKKDNYIWAPGITYGSSGGLVAIAANTDLSDVDLTGSSIHATFNDSVKFFDADLTNVDFNASDLGTADLTGATITGADLSDLINVDSRFQAMEVKGIPAGLPTGNNTVGEFNYQVVTDSDGIKHIVGTEVLA